MSVGGRLGVVGNRVMLGFVVIPGHVVHSKIESRVKTSSFNTALDNNIISRINTKRTNGTRSTRLEELNLYVVRTRSGKIKGLKEFVRDRSLPLGKHE